MNVTTPRGYRLTTEKTFKALPIMHEKSPLMIPHLERTLITLNNALDEHPRTLAIRYDLRLPSDYNSPLPRRVMAKFKRALKGYIQTDISNRKKAGVRVHRTNVRNIWCRESTKESRVHFHCCVLVNLQTYYKAGSYDGLSKGLAPMIQRAWASALGVSTGNLKGAVHFTKNGLYRVQRGSDDFAETYQSLFWRLSYMAKLNTKVYGDGNRNFGACHK